MQRRGRDYLAEEKKGWTGADTKLRVEEVEGVSSSLADDLLSFLPELQDVQTFKCNKHTDEGEKNQLTWECLGKRQPDY